MAVQIQIRRGTAAAWTAANPTLAAGEFAIETDTDKYKIGDGTTAWASLSYSSLPSGSMTTAGGTFTGPVTFDGASPIILEGATADAFETTIAVTDPTADRTITLPDATGTVAIAADVLPLTGGTLTGALTGTDATFTGTTTTYLAFNNQTASYTLVLADAGKAVEVNNASANTLTVPPNSSVAFPTGTQIIVFQQGAGVTTITAGAGVTLRSKDSNLAVDGQYASAALVKRASDEWYVTGALA